MTHRVFQPPQEEEEEQQRSDSWSTSPGLGWGGGVVSLAFLHRQQVKEADANGFHQPRSWR